MGLSQFVLGGLLVDAQVSSGHGGQLGADDLDPLVLVEITVPGEGVHGERPGVDHRVPRALRLGLDRDDVVRLARGLDIDGSQDLADAVLLEGQGVDEGLGHRLDRRLVVGVAHRVHLAVGGAQGRGQQAGVGVGEGLRDLVHLALGLVVHRVEGRCQVLVEGLAHGPNLGGRRGCLRDRPLNRGGEAAGDERMSTGQGNGGAARLTARGA